MRHIIPISGKDSLATALVQMARQPDLPYEFIFCDVSMELPETYAWIDSVERELDITITRIGKSLEQIIAEQNMLPSQSRRFCTKYGKVFPIRDYLKGSNAVQYLGIRADEEARVGQINSPGVELVYPLVELGIDLPAVYQILTHRGVLPPNFFWLRLYNAVLSRLPEYECLINSLKPWDKSALFAWRSRSNCFNCFYQRRYEWVGLLEHHPDLFERAEKLEADFSESDRREKWFGWIQGLPLASLRERQRTIFQSRVDQVCRHVAQLAQGRLYEDEFDGLTTTSCGLYCGK